MPIYMTYEYPWGNLKAHIAHTLITILDALAPIQQNPCVSCQEKTPSDRGIVSYQALWHKRDQQSCAQMPLS